MTGAVDPCAPKKMLRILLSIPTISHPWSAKNSTQADPTRPPDPVTSAFNEPRTIFPFARSLATPLRVSTSWDAGRSLNESSWLPHSIQNNMLIMLAESRSLRRKLVRHPADAGQNLFPEYYHHLFRTKLYLQQFKQVSRGIMEMRLRLYFDQLGQIPLLVPPVEEQF